MLEHSSESEESKIEGLIFEFRESIKASLEELKGKMLEASKKGRDNFPDMIEEDAKTIENLINSEFLFSREVIKAFYRWAQEQNPLVLWDIDETIGAGISTSKGKFFTLRPSMLELLGFLKKNFPNVRQGILTNKTMPFNFSRMKSRFIEHDPEYAKHISEVVGKTMQNLKPLEGLLDSAEFYSSEPETEHVTAAFSEQHNHVNDLGKILVMNRLRNVYRQNPKLVDNENVATELGSDGLCLKDSHFTPEDIISEHARAMLIKQV